MKSILTTNALPPVIYDFNRLIEGNRMDGDKGQAS